MNDNTVNNWISEIILLLQKELENAQEALGKSERESLLSTTKDYLVSIIEPLADNRPEESAKAAIENAEWLGSLGLHWFFDSLIRVKAPRVFSIRDSLLYSSGIAYRASNKRKTATKRFINARRSALRRDHKSLAACIAIDLGVDSYDHGNVKRAHKWFNQAIDEAKIVGDRMIEAKALNNIATLTMDENPASALTHIEQSLELKKEAGASEYDIMPSIGNLGVLKAKAGDSKEAYELFYRSYTYYKSIHDLPNLTLSLLNLGNEASALGRFRQASKFYEQGKNIAKEIGDHEIESLIYQNFAANAAENKQYKIAVREFNNLYRSHVKHNYTIDAGIALHDLALCEARENNTDAARSTINKALSLFRGLNEIDWQRRCLLLIAFEIEQPVSREGLGALRKAVLLKGGRDFELKLSAIHALWYALLDAGDYEAASFELDREINWKSRNPKELKERLHLAGLELLNRGREVEALKRLKQASRSPLFNDVIADAGLRQDLALALVANSHFNKALKLFSTNVDLANSTMNRVLKAANVGNIGETKRRSGNPKAAITYLREAVRLSRLFNDYKETAFWLNNLALALLDCEQYNQSKRAIERGLDAAKKVGAKAEKSRLYGTMGVIKAQNNEFEEACKYYSEAINYAYKADDIFFALKMKYNRAAAYYHLGLRNEALRDASNATQGAINHKLFDLASQVSQAAAVWAIEWKRPARSGEFAGISIIANCMSENQRAEMTAGVLVLAKQNLTQGQYEYFYKALRRQVQQINKGKLVWIEVKALIKSVNTAI